ncbi:hypothetical protein HBA55_23870 [Pseudomaricurvus alkylphenolicus]|uniref:LuxR C-terminal-related transcriptional regulator n=1 Tax=Pseudomaricurvus alkylphenolicus TaxID=1306991 RepID=UPI0014244E48|nr:LuxR C-terminal-related transcriptional regulator [Pseudomaricurvus alkylphenolicus]NIB42666.1 hypothetical protein [Pseudomaricurvus alkylphenolicus]
MIFRSNIVYHATYKACFDVMPKPKNRWIIQTKLAPPEPSSLDIGRINLRNIYTQQPRFRLCIIHAPAGYGKSNLLNNWYSFQTSLQGYVCWLSLDEYDSDRSSLYSYFVESLRVSGLELEEMMEVIESSENLSERAFSTILVNTIAESSVPVTLFLDDYHRASGGVLDSIINTLLRYAPDNFRLIIASRTFPSIESSQIRAAGQLLEIDVDDLRFDADEISQLFEARLSDLEVSDLLKKTEGWPFACTMVSYLFEKGKIKGHQFSELTGQTRELSNYITEQIFSSLSLEEQNFLLVTSLTDRFTAELAMAMDDTINPWSAINTLEKNRLFLIPLDNQDGWYRYHQLFSQYLFSRCQKSKGKMVHSLHKKASLWLFENGYIVDAINQALAAKDSDLAAGELNRAGGWRLTFSGNLDFVRNTISRLPKESIEKRPRLFLTIILTLIREGNIVEACNRADYFREHSQHYSQWHGVPLSDKEKIEWTCIADLLLGSYLDVPATDARLHYIQKLEREIDVDDSVLKGIVKGCLFHQYWERGDLAGAENSHNEWVSLIKKTPKSTVYSYTYTRINLSILDVERCNLKRASAYLEEANTLISRYPNTDFNLKAAVSVFLAEIAYCHNDITQAQSLLQDSLSHLQKFDASFKHFAPAFVTLIPIERLKGSLNSMLEAVDTGHRISEDRRIPRLKHLCSITQAKQYLLTGEIAAAEKTMEESGIFQLFSDYPNESDLSIYLPELSGVLVSRLLIEKSQYQQAAEALIGLEATLRKQHRNRLLVEVLLLRCRCGIGLDDTDSAASFLNAAVEISMYEDYFRPFIDEGRHISKITKQVLASETAKELNRYHKNFLRSITQMLNKEQSSRSARSTGLGLSEKEYEVLIRVAKGLSNKEIARILDVPEDNIKYQLRKVFKKWNISNRSDAANIVNRKLLELKE